MLFKKVKKLLGIGKKTNDTDKNLLLNREKVLNEFKDFFNTEFKEVQLITQDYSKTEDDLSKAFRIFCSNIMSYIDALPNSKEHSLDIINYLYKELPKSYNLDSAILTSGIAVSCLSKVKRNVSENELLIQLADRFYFTEMSDLNFLLEEYTRNNPVTSIIKNALNDFNFEYERHPSGHMIKHKINTERQAVCTRPDHGFVFVNRNDAYIVPGYIIEMLEPHIKSNNSELVYDLFCKIIGENEVAYLNKKLGDTTELSIEGKYVPDRSLFDAAKDCTYHFVDNNISVADLADKGFITIQ
jgi:hypothetical protein